MDGEDRISGIPWRDWIPDFSIPKICDIEDCEKPVTRAVCWSEVRGNLEYRVYSFVCEDCGPKMNLMLKRIRDVDSQTNR